jgi:hypothetical protein
MRQIDPIVNRCHNFYRLANSSTDASASFKYALRRLLLKEVPHNEIISWIELNKLESLASGYWSRAVDDSTEYMTSAHPTAPRAEQDHEFFIGLSPKEPTQFDIDVSKPLRGFGEIPKLHLCSGTIKTGLGGTYPKELAHDDFVVKALAKIADLDFLDSKDLATIHKFLKDNKSKIDSIRKSFAFQPRELGAGSDGIAFAINDRQVLKIFSSRTAYQSAHDAMARMHKGSPTARTEANIYDVGVLGQVVKSDSRRITVITVYYYILERMATGKQLINSNANLRVIIDFMTGRFLLPKFEKARGQITEMTRDGKDGEAHSEAKKLSRSIRNMVISDPECISSIKNINDHEKDINSDWLDLLSEEVVYKLLTNREDLHVGNIGKNTMGEFRFFDPSYE